MKRVILASVAALMCTSALGADLRLWPGETPNGPAFYPAAPPAIVFDIAPFAFGPVLFPNRFHLICNPYGCRSSANRPPIVVTGGPPVVQERLRGGVPLGAAVRTYQAPPVVDPPPVGRPTPPLRQNTRPSRPDVAVPPPDATPDAGTIKDGKEIEDDILAFCDDKPDTPFCAKLGAYLRAHPRPK